VPEPGQYSTLCPQYQPAAWHRRVCKSWVIKFTKVLNIVYETYSIQMDKIAEAKTEYPLILLFT
jgi:hypothetical protein